MSDVEAVTGLLKRSVVSTFSGAGGSCLGYRMAGFDVLWASEFIPAAREVYALNAPSTILDGRDIRDVKGDDILSALSMSKGDIDLLDGSPPCASFSTSGKRAGGWGKVKAYSDTTQRTDDLFFEYARLLRELQPKTFVAENVSGLIKGVAKGYFKLILQELQESGYRVTAKLLDAQWLGVPQSRQRLIFLGVREDLKRDPVFPKPLAYRYTIREIMPYILMLKLGGSPERWRPPTQPAATVVQSDGYRKSTTAYLSSYLVRDAENERRHWTIDELRLLFSVPHDFKLTGSFGQQWERLGRMVPPLMMKRIAETMYKEILHDVS